MTDRVFIPGDILLPQGVDMGLWSVIACDQFTSEPEYWDEVEEKVGETPSTLKLMLPEAYLKLRDTEAETIKVEAAMKDYLSRGIFKTLTESFVYTERLLTNGRIRHGLLGLLDLEHYDYKKAGSSLISPTEGTVEERLPPRVEVRKRAELELPHIVVFIDDPDCAVIESLGFDLKSPELLYDFDLMCGGGHISGWAVTGEKAAEVEKSMEKLFDPKVLDNTDMHKQTPVVFAVGDGNHSLATSKLTWENLKPSLSPEERERHPARYSLVELVNIHDPAVEFEPIHRVVFDTNPATFIEEARKFYSGFAVSGDEGYKIKLVAGNESAELTVSGLTVGELIGKAEKFCEEYISKYGGEIDYIHGDDTAETMGTRTACAAILLPKLAKNELFPSIIKSGAFPKKSFSIGHAQDKRYYLECRKIKQN